VDQDRLKSILESLLFAAGEPVPIARFAAVLENVSKEELRKSLADLSMEYASSNRGIRLEQVAGGYQFRTAKEHALYVRRLLAAKPPRLTRPLLETLAIIAYRQPITGPEIEQLRGVDSSGVLDTLLDRRLVKIAGRKEAPGRPIIYATTPEFLETFGLKDLDGLPDIGELQELQKELQDQIDEERTGSEEPATPDHELSPQLPLTNDSFAEPPPPENPELATERVPTDNSASNLENTPSNSSESEEKSN
jgi:segregation and condensation protein B